MGDPFFSVDRLQTRREEFANVASHGVGVLLAVAGLPVLVQCIARQPSRRA